jgi:hypothetical protein
MLARFFSAILAAFILLSALPLRSQESPYLSIVVWYSMTICAVRYGLMTAEEGTQRLLDTAMKVLKMEPWQVANLMKASGFDDDSAKHIEAQGGCRKMNEYLVR